MIISVVVVVNEKGATNAKGYMGIYIFLFVCLSKHRNAIMHMASLFILYHLDIWNYGGHSNLAYINNLNSVLLVRLSEDINKTKFVVRSNIFYWTNK